MNKKKSLEPCLPPNLEMFLKEKYWAIHEAVFVITKWPEANMNMSYLSKGSSKGEMEINRSWIYLPENLKVEPREYGERFEEVYKNLKEAIEKGELVFETQRIDEVVYFVQPQSVITWALLKGYIFLDYVQAVLGIRQITSISQLSSKTRNVLPSKVREKILAQFILKDSPHLERKKLYTKVLRYLYPEDSRMLDLGRKDMTTIRQNLNELYDSPGRRGRKQIEKKYEDSFSFRPIKQVLEVDSFGNHYYNFPLFKVAMDTAVRYRMSSLNEDERQHITKDEFVDKFIQNDIIRPYLQGNEYATRIILSSIEHVWSELNFWMTSLNFANTYCNLPS